MSITKDSTNTNDRRINGNSFSSTKPVADNTNPINAVQTPSDEISFGEIFNQITQLGSKVRGSNKLNVPASAIANMINILSQNGIYRNDDTVLVVTMYSLVVSTKDCEYAININQSMLSALFDIAVYSDDYGKLLDALRTALEYLHVEYEEHVSQSKVLYTNSSVNNDLM